MYRLRELLKIDLRLLYAENNLRVKRGFVKTHQIKDMKKQEVITIPINLLFKGKQLELWNLLDFRPRPTWVFSELVGSPTKNVSTQLKQMSNRTGLVKFKSEGKLKHWYKYEPNTETANDF